VDEFELRRLLGHGSRNLRHAVTDEIDSSGARKVKIAFSGGVPEVDAFSAYSGGETLAKGTAQNGRCASSGGHVRIIDGFLQAADRRPRPACLPGYKKEKNEDICAVVR